MARTVAVGAEVGVAATVAAGVAAEVAATVAAVVAAGGAFVGLPPPAQPASTTTRVRAPAGNVTVDRNIGTASFHEGRPKRVRLSSARRSTQ